MKKPLRLGMLASHGGSNMQAVIDASKAGTLDARVVVVISNNSHSRALERARSEGIPAFHLSSAHVETPEELDEAILKTLRGHEVDIVCLAGYMKKLGRRTLEAYRNRVLNIHPALLPKFGGKGMFGIHVHEAVLAAGESESGASIHIVTPEYDRGPVIAQARVPVMPGDTPETLAKRVLEQEHQLYWQTLQRIADGDIDLDHPA